MRRLTASGLLPDRAGHAVKALVHMTLAELRAMDGGSVLQAEWTAAAAARWATRRAAASVTGSDGGAWLAGPPAQAVACDAILVPVVTGDIDIGALEDLVRLCVRLDRLDHHQAPPPGGEPGPAPRDGRPPGTRPARAPPAAARRSRCRAACPARNSGRSSGSRCARRSSAKPSTWSPAPAGWRPSCAAGSSA